MNEGMEYGNYLVRSQPHQITRFTLMERVEDAMIGICHWSNNDREQFNMGLLKATIPTILS